MIMKADIDKAVVYECKLCGSNYTSEGKVLECIDSHLKSYIPYDRLSMLYNARIDFIKISKLEIELENRIKEELSQFVNIDVDEIYININPDYEVEILHIKVLGKYMFEKFIAFFEDIFGKLNLEIKDILIYIQYKADKNKEYIFEITAKIMR